MSDKIGSHHLQRRAILYVRQSSSHQVIHNEESRRLQYAMRGRLRDLGWQEIEVVDDDLGHSAAGAGLPRSAVREMTIAEGPGRSVGQSMVPEGRAAGVDGSAKCRSDAPG